MKMKSPAPDTTAGFNGHEYKTGHDGIVDIDPADAAVATFHGFKPMDEAALGDDLKKDSPIAEARHVGAGKYAVFIDGERQGEEPMMKEDAQALVESLNAPGK